MAIVIKNTSIEELDRSCEIMDKGIAFQKRKGHPHYLTNDRQFHERDILLGQHYTVYVDGEVGGIFSLSFNDKVIWRDKEKGDAVYLHRIITKDEFKGQRLLQHIIDWTIRYTRNQKRKYIRLDTWDNNPPLVDYYKSFGFYISEHFTMPQTDELSVNAWGNDVVLMQLDVSNSPRGTKKYMIVERFHTDKVKEMYKQFETRGRMLPKGVTYIDSWIDGKVETCFQLMESESEDLLNEWVHRWKDYADFEIIPVQSSADAKTKILKNS